jgi:hypothetical protein
MTCVSLHGSQRADVSWRGCLPAELVKHNLVDLVHQSWAPPETIANAPFGYSSRFESCHLRANGDPIAFQVIFPEQQKALASIAPLSATCDWNIFSTAVPPLAEAPRPLIARVSTECQKQLNT